MLGKNFLLSKVFYPKQLCVHKSKFYPFPIVKYTGIICYSLRLEVASLTIKGLRGGWKTTWIIQVQQAYFIANKFDKLGGGY